MKPKESTEQPVKLTVRFSCGCGFNCDRGREAVSHCEETKHTLTVNGIVKFTPS